MAKQAVGCRNMVRVKVWHTHITVWLLKKIQSTYFNVLYAYFITGPNVRSHSVQFYAYTVCIVFATSLACCCS